MTKERWFHRPSLNLQSGRCCVIDFTSTLVCALALQTLTNIIL